jgi:hypothetical protein
MHDGLLTKQASVAAGLTALNANLFVARAGSPHRDDTSGDFQALAISKMTQEYLNDLEKTADR